jgi:hypothetical protein
LIQHIALCLDALADFLLKLIVALRFNHRRGGSLH